MVHKVAENFQTVNQYPVPSKHSLCIRTVSACEHFQAPVDVRRDFKFRLVLLCAGIGQSTLLNRCPQTIGIHDNLPICELNKILGVIVGRKKGPWIHKDIQLYSVNKRSIVISLMICRNNQSIKITVEVVAAIRIGTVNNDGNRGIALLKIF